MVTVVLGVQGGEEFNKMIVIYYRNEKGKIYLTHGGNGMSIEDIRQKCDDFNSSPTNGDRQAFVEEYEEDSLTAYLFEKMNEKRRYDKEAIDDAIYQINGVVSFLEELKYDNKI